MKIIIYILLILSCSIFAYSQSCYKLVDKYYGDIDYVKAVSDSLNIHKSYNTLYLQNIDKTVIDTFSLSAFIYQGEKIWNAIVLDSLILIIPIKSDIILLGIKDNHFIYYDRTEQKYPLSDVRKITNKSFVILERSCVKLFSICNNKIQYKSELDFGRMLSNISVAKDTIYVYADSRIYCCKEEQNSIVMLNNYIVNARRQYYNNMLSVGEYIVMEHAGMLECYRREGDIYIEWGVITDVDGGVKEMHYDNMHNQINSISKIGRIDVFALENKMERICAQEPAQDSIGWIYKSDIYNEMLYLAEANAGIFIYKREIQTMIRDKHEECEIYIYPNPAVCGTVVLHCNNNALNQLRIYNQTGKLIHQTKNISNDILRLPIERDVLYLYYQLKENNMWHMQKVVVY